MFSNLPNGIEAQVEPRHHCLDHEVRDHAESRALSSTIELSASLPPAYCQRPYHVDGCRRVAGVPFLLDPVSSGHSLNSKNPYKLAHARHFEGVLYMQLKDLQRSEAAAAQAMTLSTQHDFLYIRDEARVVLGRTRAQLDQTNQAVSVIHQGLSDRIKNGSRADITFFLMFLAEAQMLYRNIDEALITIEDALEANPEEFVYRPLLLNCRGDLRRQLEQADLAEDDFREAVSLAKKMNAKAVELRAATSLVRLLQSRGAYTAARDLLAPLYGWFTEGFDTADLKEAKALLEDLNK